MLIRSCKIGLIAIVAIFFTLAVFNNTTDYGTNADFVMHVLSMDTVFPDSKITWRAITFESLHTLLYCVVIAWEALAAIVCWFAAFKLFAARHDANLFKQKKPLAFLGLSIGLALYAFVFIAVGGEWFVMWQSPQWNGQSSASIFINMIGLVLLIVMTADE